MNHIEAMKQALKALAASDDFLFNYHDCEPNNEREMDAYSEIRANNHEAITTLRTAIEAAEKQEPYGQVTVVKKPGCVDMHWFYRWPDPPYLDNAAECHIVYTTPPAAPVQEPVGWFKYDKVSGCWHPQHDEFAPTHAVREGWKQLYTTPHVAPVQDGSAFFKQFQTGLMDVAPAAPVQEPVATVVRPGKGWNVWLSRLVEPGTTLYTVPPNVATPLAAQRQWVGLTDEDLANCSGHEVRWALYWDKLLKEKNT
jgi:hypothetical protein